MFSFFFFFFFFYILGFLLAISFFIPFTYEFFLGFKLELPPSPLSLNLFTKIDEYLSFFFSSLFSFLLLFQLPLFFMLISLNNLISYNFLIIYRKYNFILSLIFFSIISPPDLISLFFFALPFIFFYESMIFLLLISKEYSEY